MYSKKEKTWIIGPCALEDEANYYATGKELARIMEGKDWYYKASFDKANRSTVTGERGVGLEKAISIFKKMKKLVPGIRLVTDVHETHQVKQLAGVIDCIQIPAFLCRQTDLLVECGKHFDKVEIKKGQWVSPSNIIHSAAKVKSQNPNAEVWVCDRGTFFGYEKLIVDLSIVPLLKKHFDKVFIDTTHSTQGVNGDGRIVGDRELAKRYLVSSTIFGYDGIFAETHPDPDTSITDSTCMIHLHHMEELIKLHDILEDTFHENIKLLNYGDGC